MILFLDFDGVLHADDVFRTKKGIVLKNGGSLFEHAPILVSILESQPDVKIVLSTSWVRELGFNRAKKQLPSSLQNRIIGATYHSDFDREDLVEVPWRDLTRYEQIAQHVSSNRIANWLAVDNDNAGWPESQAHRLVLTDDWLGLNDVTVQRQLAQALRMDTQLISQGDVSKLLES